MINGGMPEGNKNMVTPSRQMSEYEKESFIRFQNCDLTTDSDKLCELRNSVKRIMFNQARYLAVGSPYGIPFWVIGLVHYRESDFNFTEHLHNGDPLTARTVHVPSGHPVNGNPPFTWEESARDALSLEGWNKKPMWDCANILVRLEAYNGFGYKMKGIRSPYIWNYTDQYTAGLFVQDGVFAPKAVDKEAGCAALMRVLKQMGVDLRENFPE